jgi:hypothetical protein
VALPVTITGLSTAVAPVGPFVRAAGSYDTVAIDTYGTADSSTRVSGISSTVYVAQTFTNGASSLSISSITIALCKSGTPTDQIYLELTTARDGTVLATSNMINASSITATSFLSPQSLTFTFPSAPAPISASATFAIVLKRTGAGDLGNAVEFPLGQAYAGGAMSTFDQFGGWQATTQYDLHVKINTALIVPNNLYYFFGRNGTTATTLSVFKSTDPTTSWAVLGAGKTGFTTAILTLNAYRVGSVVHMLVCDGTAATSVATKYVSFDMATETWLATTETVAAAAANTGTAGTTPVGGALVVRSNGEVVAFYNGLQVKTSGTFYARVYYRRRTALNTWSTQTQVDANTANDNTRPIALLGAAGRVHFFWAAASPNTAFRTLSAANALSTYATNSNAYPPGDGVTYDRGGTIKGILASGGGNSQVLYFDSSDAPTITAAGFVAANYGSPTRIGADGTDVTLVYRNISDSDLYTIKSTNDGVTWGTAASFFVGTVAAGEANLSRHSGEGSAIFMRGGSTLLPYIVNDNGTWKYNEYVVRAPAIADAWNVNDKHANTGLSNGDKTATQGVATSGGVRSTTSNATGKFYAEFVLGAGSPALGLKNLASALIDQSTNSTYYYPTSGNVYVNGTNQSAGLAAAIPGDVISVAWSTTDKRIWFRKNNDGWNPNRNGDPGAGLGGLDLTPLADSTLALWFGSNGVGNAATVRTEKDEFTQSAPSGFLSWMGETLVIPDMGTLVADVATIAASGKVESKGTGTLAASTSAVASQAVSRSVGTGTLVAATSTLIGTGTASWSASGALNAGASSGGGVGQVVSPPVTGTGALAATVAALAGNGVAGSTGTSSLAVGIASATGAGTVGGNEVGQYLARTTGLTNKRKETLTTYINALVAGGVWEKLQAHYVLAAPDVANALVNLKSASFLAVAQNSPAFTPDVGFQGVELGQGFIDTGYSPATHGILNDAHLSCWNNTNVASQNPLMGACNGDQSNGLYLYPNSDGKTYVNVNGFGDTEYLNPPDLRGLYVATRESSAKEISYYNADDKNGTPDRASTGLTGFTVWILAVNFAGGVASGGYSAKTASIGRHLTPEQVTALYNAQVQLFADMAAEVATGTGALQAAPTGPKNLVLWSQGFDNSASWLAISLTVTANAATAPDGTTTAERLVNAASFGSHFVQQQVRPVETAGGYVFSVYMKAGTATWVQIYPSFTERANFNLQTGVVGLTNNTTASITDAGNGWWRCSVTVAQSSVFANMSIAFLPADQAGITYAGDTNDLYIWGAQFELGAVPTQYIPTTTVAAYAGHSIVGVGTVTAAIGSTGPGALACSSATLAGSGNVADGVFEHLRPDGDVALDGWTDNTGGTSNIYAAIDETTASDVDYVQSPPIADVAVEQEKLVASFAPGFDRDDFPGWLGLKFTPTSDMVVNQLGARCGTGNTGNRNVVLQGTGLNTIASAAIDMTGGTVGLFYYAPIAPVTLVAGLQYYLYMQTNASSGQFWSNQGPLTLNGASGAAAIYTTTLTSGPNYADANAMFGGVDLQYEGAPIIPGQITHLKTERTGLGNVPGAGVPWWVNVPLGIPHENRRILICLGYCYNGIAAANNITINGTVATIIGVHTGTHPSIGAFGGEFVWAYADVPTGTTATIDFDDGQIDGGGYVICSLFSFDKSLFVAAPVLAMTDIAPATTTTVSVNVEEGAFIVAAFEWNLFVLPGGPPVIASSTETYVKNYEHTDNQVYSVSGAGAASPSSMTLTWPTSTSSLASMLTWPRNGARAAARASADLKVRLFEGATQIAEWTHTDVSASFADAVQTLTAPQVAAISNYANLFIELDDNHGNVYRAQLGNPGAVVEQPVKLKYRYKKLVA